MPYGSQHLRRSGAVLGVGILLALLLASSSQASNCPVPSIDHPTLQQALDDRVCTTVTLGVRSYPESILVERSVVLMGQGPSSSTIDGRIKVLGSAGHVTLESLGVRSGCAAAALSALPGAHVTPTDVTIDIAALPCPPFASVIFSDDFESGNLLAWSAVVP